MVPGKVLLRYRQVLTANETAIHAETQAQAEAVARRVAADTAHRWVTFVVDQTEGCT